jgi:hypothetical protein
MPGISADARGELLLTPIAIKYHKNGHSCNGRAAESGNL